MRIRFWQNNISPHHAEVYNALAAMPEVSVSLVVQGEISPERIRLGWREPELRDVQIVRNWDESAADGLLDDPHTVEIFIAPWGYRKIRSAFRRAVPRSQVPLAMISEPGDWRGLSGAIRVARGRLHSMLYGRRLAFVLAIGDLAEEWFLKCGYPSHKIFPYIYTTRPPSEVPALYTTGGRRLIFVGQLVQRKGLDRLLIALADFRDNDWELMIVGNGPGRPYFQWLTSRLGLGNRVHFSGGVSNEDISARIGKSDLLVLPSRWDGWGAVVNEALHEGVPVLVGERCGAKRLVQRELSGAVFREAESPKLKEALGEIFSRPPLSSTERAEISERAKAISGTTVAEYLVQVVRFSVEGKGTRPSAPWDCM